MLHHLIASSIASAIRSSFLEIKENKDRCVFLGIMLKQIVSFYLENDLLFIEECKKIKICIELEPLNSVKHATLA